MKRNATWLAGALAIVAVGAMAQDTKPQRKVGYSDTPMLPGGKWHVHDGTRPQPPIVDPGPPRTRMAPVPPGAIVLFDGTDTSKWTNPKWKAVDGAFMARAEGEKVERVGDTATKDTFTDFQLHIEWATPTPHGEIDQGRGNSGVFLADRYEIQVLDCYDNITYPDGQAGAVYGQTPPLVNASRKPGEWQTYDIYFKAPRFGDDGKIATNARVTVIHNGYVVQNNTEILGGTNHRTLPTVYEKFGPAPIHLQDHGNAVKYRNIWIRPLEPGS